MSGKMFEMGKRAHQSWLLGMLLSLSSCAFEAGTEAEAWGEAEASVVKTPPAFCSPFLLDNCCDSEKYQSCKVLPASADFKVKIYNCHPPSYTGQILREVCEVEPGWTLIGGGGRVFDGDLDQTVILYSGPSETEADSLQTDRRWRFVTESLGQILWHRSAVYAIGMKMTGYDNVHHLSPIHLTMGEWATPLAKRAESITRVPQGEILLGGGWYVGSYAYRSLFPVDAYADGMLNGRWIVRASDLGRNFSESAMGMAISIERCPARWSSCFSGRNIFSGTSSTGTGAREALAFIQPGYVPVGFGAISSSWDRPINKLFPYVGPGAELGSAWAGTYSSSKSGYVNVSVTALAR